MILFFDTETSGIWHNDLPVDHSAQPDMIQLGVILTDEDGKEMSKLSVIIKPDGWTVPAEAAAIHGISDYRARSTGVPLVSALALFSALCAVSTKVVGHNLSFDWNIMERAYWRIGRPHRLPKTGICTMLTMCPVLQLPKTRGKVTTKDAYKWPSLQESFMHAFGQKFEGAHDALADVEATKAVYFWGKGHGVEDVAPKIRFKPATGSKGARTGPDRDFTFLTTVMDGMQLPKLSEWEQDFVVKMRAQIDQYGDRTMLSNKQWPIVEKLYQKYLVKGAANVN